MGFRLCAQEPAPLPNGFSHNDYWRKRPLYDALQNGYTWVEADVYVRRKRLVVTHMLPFFKRRRTLDRLYLEPLLTGKDRRGDILPDVPVTIMVDIKSKSRRTYRALDALLEKYQSIVTSCDSGVVTRRKVTVIVSGKKPVNLIRSQQCRRVFIDEDLRRCDRDSCIAPVSLMASCRYSRLLRWTGRGDMPEKERVRLCSFVQTAHRYDEKVRLWAAPENAQVWKALLECGVDLINTNQLVKLKTFLQSDIAQNKLFLSGGQ
jgi:hypothetical protein